MERELLRETRLKEKYWRAGMLAASKLVSRVMRPPRLRLGLHPRQRLRRPLTQCLQSFGSVAIV